MLTNLLWAAETNSYVEYSNAIAQRPLSQHRLRTNAQREVKKAISPDRGSHGYVDSSANPPVVSPKF